MCGDPPGILNIVFLVTHYSARRPPMEEINATFDFWVLRSIDSGKSVSVSMVPRHKKYGRPRLPPLTAFRHHTLLEDSNSFIIPVKTSSKAWHFSICTSCASRARSPHSAQKGLKLKIESCVNFFHRGLPFACVEIHQEY